MNDLFKVYSDVTDFVNERTQDSYHTPTIASWAVKYAQARAASQPVTKPRFELNLWTKTAGLDNIIAHRIMEHIDGRYDLTADRETQEVS